MLAVINMLLVSKRKYSTPGGTWQIFAILKVTQYVFNTTKRTNKFVIDVPVINIPSDYSQ